MFRRLFLCFTLLLTTTVSADPRDDAPLQDEIRSLIHKLGDESYVVRERATTKLLRIGIDASPELLRARKDPDREISRRAEQILARFEIHFIEQEHEAVRPWVNAYALADNIVDKGRIIWVLVSPFADTPGGEGLRTLCRIARFDERNALRAEAVKALIASPPVAPSKRRKWFRTIRETFTDPTEDERIGLLTRFADLYCELDDRKEKAENDALQKTRETGVPVAWPVELAVDEPLRQRVRDLTDRIAAFQADPENNAICGGNRNDILLFYALAELQGLVGLKEERDRTVAAALIVRTEEMQNDTPIEIDEQLAGFDPLRAAQILRYRYCLDWSTRQALPVLENGHIRLKVKAARLISESYQLRRQFDEAVRYLDQALELVQSTDYTTRYSDSGEESAKFRAGRSLCLAQKAADADDWDEVRKQVEQGLKDDPFELDLLILGWQLGQRRPEIGDEYRKDIDRKITDTIRESDRKMRQEGNPEARQYRAVSACNQAAWILANTNGDYATALNLIETAVKADPEDIAYLDTLAHVYRLGGHFDKAVETQERVVRTAPEGTIFHDALERFRNERK